MFRARSGVGVPGWGRARAASPRSGVTTTKGKKERRKEGRRGGRTNATTTADDELILVATTTRLYCVPHRRVSLRGLTCRAVVL